MFVRVVGLIAVLVATGPARAHGLDAHRAQVELEGAVVRVALTPGAEALPEVDRDGDGVLTRDEVAVARDAVRARFAQGFTVLDGAGPEAPRAVCDDVFVSTVGAGAPHLRVSLRCAFLTGPSALVLLADGLGTEPYRVEAVRLRRVSDARWEPVGAVARAELPGDRSGRRSTSRRWRGRGARRRRGSRRRERPAPDGVTGTVPA